MRATAVDLQCLLAVAAARLDADGVLLDANAGFLRLLPAAAVPRVGTRVGRYFIQPAHAALQAAAVPGGAGYEGMLTIGDREGKTRTLRGRVWRGDDGLRLLAECDIVELERVSDAVLALNRENSLAQHQLAGTNLELRQREQHIVEQSLTDTLTGVGNRRRLEQALEVEVERVRRQGGSLSAIMTDVDHFKRVNDGYGHPAGDRVLMRLGALLRELSRANDIVARFGGEEFVLLLPHTDLAQAAAKAELLRSALAGETIAPLPQPVTASFGVAELAAGEDGAALLQRVDAALYLAKAGGRNRVVRAATP